MAVMVCYPPDIKKMVEEVRKYEGKKEEKPLAIQEKEEKIRAWRREQFRLEREIMLNS
ncbi:MAG: hypothetical protein E6Z06_07525 [Clostridiales bacterium]|nr:hypothetical protein [Clostridiales bacterium]MDU1029500.1 hypothetical protein [Clostridiales bacterium]MDU5952712.1 hypothetical protein [Clostridiales bacterium]